jgi:hypothetical protein
MEFSTAAYVRLKREGGTISLEPLAALASAVAKRPITVRWGTWQRQDLLRRGDGLRTDLDPGSLGHWDPTNNEIVLHRSLGWSLDQRLPEVFYHELVHAMVPRRGESTQQREAQAEQFAEKLLRRVGPGFVWWLVGGMVDHEA